jgi:hypothetical protein
MPPSHADLPQGTLDLPVQTPQGTLSPALHRLENRGLPTAEGRESDGGREARYYRPTAKGRPGRREETENWRQSTEAVRPIPAAGEGMCKCPLVGTLRKRSGNILCALIVALCALIYVRTSVLPPIPTLAGPSDFFGYYQAAEDILHGRSPYHNPAFFYPPLLAFLMVPLALLNYVLARWIWFALSHLFLIGAGALLWRGMGGGRIALCCIAGVWALGGAGKEALLQGQLSPLLVLLLVIAYTRRGPLQAASAGLSFALKYFPGIIALPLLLGRRRRALAVSAGVALAGVCVPWLILWWFFSGARTPVSAHYWMGTPSMFSWSIPSVVLRRLIPIARGEPLPRDWEFGNVAATLHLGPRLAWISVATACAVFAIGIIALAVVSRGRLNGRQIPWAMAGTIALSLAVAPVCWSHYQLLQYPGVAMLLIAAIRRRDWRLSLATAACFALAYQLPERFLIVYHDTHNGWTTASPCTLYFWTSAPAFASLEIFTFALVMARRRGARRGPIFHRTGTVRLADSRVGVLQECQR